MGHLQFNGNNTGKNMSQRFGQHHYFKALKNVNCKKKKMFYV